MANMLIRKRTSTGQALTINEKIGRVSYIRFDELMPRRPGIGGLGSGPGVHGLKSAEAARVSDTTLPVFVWSERSLQAVARDVGDKILQEQREQVRQISDIQFFCE